MRECEIISSQVAYFMYVLSVWKLKLQKRGFKHTQILTSIQISVGKKFILINPLLWTSHAQKDIS